MLVLTTCDENDEVLIRVVIIPFILVKRMEEQSSLTSQLLNVC